MGAPGRVLAIDVGDRRIGVAVSDPLRVIASPVTTLERTRAGEDAAAIRRMVLEWSACLVVAGLPLLPSGERGEQAQKVESFVGRLSRVLEVPIVMWDESYTTVEAESRMRARGKSPRESKDTVDAEAAAVILEEWMREHPHDPDEVAEQLDERRDRHDG